jgi:hypothetical protein
VCVCVCVCVFVCVCVCPVTICATKQIPKRGPMFHQSLTVYGVGKSTRASFAILNKGYLFRVGLFIILCVVVVPEIR